MGAKPALTLGAADAAGVPAVAAAVSPFSAGGRPCRLLPPGREGKQEAAGHARLAFTS